LGQRKADYIKGTGKKYKTAKKAAEVLKIDQSTVVKKYKE
jgi:hypothetical protein